MEEKIQDNTSAFLNRLGFLLRRKSKDELKEAFILAIKGMSKRYTSDISIERAFDILYGFKEGRFSLLIFDLQKVVRESGIPREELEIPTKLILAVAWVSLDHKLEN